MPTKVPRIIVCQTSYTARFASLMQKSWLAHLGSRLESVDLVSLVTLESPDIAAGESYCQGLNLESQKIEAIYAFHPQARDNPFGCSYVNESMISFYNAAVRSTGCLNPPSFGRWGQHLSALQGLRLLNECDLLHTPVYEDVPGVFHPSKTFLLYNLEHHLVGGEANGWHIPVNADEFRTQTVFVHIIRDEVLIYDRAGKMLSRERLGPGKQKLLKLLHCECLELVGVQKGRDINYLGIHPCLTIFPKETLRKIQDAFI